MRLLLALFLLPIAALAQVPLNSLVVNGTTVCNGNLTSFSVTSGNIQATCPTSTPTPPPSPPPTSGCTGPSTPLTQSGQTVYPSVAPNGYKAYSLLPFTNPGHQGYLFSVAPDGVTGSNVTAQIAVSQCPGTAPISGCSMSRVIGPNGFNLRAFAESNTCSLQTGTTYYLNVTFPDASCKSKVCSLVLTLNTFTQ